MRRCTPPSSPCEGGRRAGANCGGMLVLTRKVNQAIAIGDEVRVVVVAIEGDQVRLGIEAPRSVAVARAEIRPDEAPAEAP